MIMRMLMAQPQEPPWHQGGGTGGAAVHAAIGVPEAVVGAATTVRAGAVPAKLWSGSKMF